MIFTNPFTFVRRGTEQPENISDVQQEGGRRTLGFNSDARFAIRTAPARLGGPGGCGVLVRRRDGRAGRIHPVDRCRCN